MEETLNTIKKRYIHERSIYTWCGIALVAVNPYQEQDIYGDQAVETYHSASHSVYLQLDPHIYAVTEDAYSKLERNSKNQSIIVSGESGAGKTVSAKHAMRYLASIAGSTKTPKHQIENKVLASNPIMEAIGNASTVRNDNSSRFGKYIQIFFDRHNRKILGANMRTYLLEKSRVTKQQAGERNFHLFYQLLGHCFKEPIKMSHLKLIKQTEDSCQMRRFKYLGNQMARVGGGGAGAGGSGSSSHNAEDDLKRFNESLKTLNIDEMRIDMIYRIVAGILHGGNIEFEPLDEESNENDQGCRIKLGTEEDRLHFNACCELIGLDRNELETRLTTKLLRTGPREVIKQTLSKVKAEYARDAMMKYIYECLFTWLVGLINLSLGSGKDKLTLANSLTSELTSHDLNNNNNNNNNVLKSPSKQRSILDQIEPQFIGVLDIYGFENFKTNSFEQFCINYANEVLQQQYNQHVFKLEQEEYIREGIDWTFIEYSDNQPVIDIIESRPIGILNLLDEECRMPKGSDRSWCGKLFEHLLIPGTKQGSSEGSVFKKPKLNYQTSFCINHYAEEVTYVVDTFLEKNRDTICEEQSELLRQSEVINYIFEDPLLSSTSSGSVEVAAATTIQKIRADRSRHKPNKTTTVGYQFRGSLAALIRTLNDTEPHYIRCIKPNDEKKAFVFNEERAVQQLKACGVYETIRISNNGFPSRWLYRDFAKRYCVLIYGTPVFDKLAAESMERQKLQMEETEQQNNNDNNVDDNSNDKCLKKKKRNDSLENGNKQVDDREDDEQLRNVSKTLNNLPMKTQEIGASVSRFMRHFSSADVRPICDSICKIAYEDNSIYRHLRTKEEQNYINQLEERHGRKPSAIYQFGKTKIFFRAGQVGYLERIRSQKIKGYTITIQRHIRGWLARRSFRKKREDYLEQLRREASLVSLQNHINSLQTELEQVKEEKLDIVQENVSRLGCCYKLIVDMMYAKIQPLIIGAILEYEALDQPEPFSSFTDNQSSLSRSNSPSNSTSQQPMEDLLNELNKFYDLIRKNLVPDDVAIQAFKQLFYLICAQSLNQLLIRRDLCQFRKAMQISFNLSCLIQWCRERYLIHWREIVEQLDPITQATKLLQTRKSSEDIATIEEVCNKLRPSQIIKILNMYTSSYEEQITTDFIHELENYLNESRCKKQQESTETNETNEFSREIENNQEGEDESLRENGKETTTAPPTLLNDLLMDTKMFFEFVDIEVES